MSEQDWETRTPALDPQEPGLETPTDLEDLDEDLMDFQDVALPLDEVDELLGEAGF